MTMPPEDEALVQFLRHHRPQPPPASPTLETQLMAAIEQAPQRQPSQRPLARRRWAIPALAASLLLVGGGWVSWRQGLQLAGDAPTLTDTWYTSAYGEDAYRIALDTSDPDWLFSVYATPY